MLNALLIAHKNYSLPFFVLNLRFHIVDRVRGFNLKGDGLAGKSLDKDLHSSTKTQDKMQSRLFLNVVIGKSATILELLASEDESLLIRRNAVETV